MTWARDYEVDEQELVSLAGDELLTASEYNRLARWSPKVNGTVLNQLAKRGGEIAERLGRVRSLKSARPEFAAKARR